MLTIQFNQPTKEWSKIKSKRVKGNESWQPAETFGFLVVSLGLSGTSVPSFFLGPAFCSV